MCCTLLHSLSCFHETTGKLSSQRLAVTCPPGIATHSRLFYVTDQTSGTRSLIDTGADVTVLLPSPSERWHPGSLKLQVVNYSSICTYGEKSLSLDFGLHCLFRWIFIIAVVPIPILGADFLAHFGLCVDIRQWHLVDTATTLCVQGITSSHTSSSPVCGLPNVTPPHRALLDKFPDILRPSYQESTVKHTVTHHLHTKGPPVLCRTRRLPPD